MTKSITQTLIEFEYNEINVQNLWYDWFCNKTSLYNKSISLLKKLKAISSSNKFDNNKTYVFFKNNCPCVGKLFDDFRICDIKTGDVIYTIIPKSGFAKDNGKAILYGKDNNFKEPILTGSWKDIKNWFLDKE